MPPTPDDSPAAASALLAPKTALFLAWIEGAAPASEEMPRFDEVDLSAAALEGYLAQQEAVPAWWSEARGAMELREVQLPGVHLRRACLPGADLRGANLAGGALGEIQLDGRAPESRHPSGRGPAGRHPRRERAGRGDLRDALLEEAPCAARRCASPCSHGAVLEHAHLNGADLWGASGEGTLCAHADFSQAILREASFPGMQAERVCLRGADLWNASLAGLTCAVPTCATRICHHTKLRGAILSEARLQGLVLYDCDITHVYLADAWMDRTMLRQEQLGGRDRRGARGGVRGSGAAATRCWSETLAQLGDTEATSWAYLKRRRMQKLAQAAAGPRGPAHAALGGRAARTPRAAGSIRWWSGSATTARASRGCSPRWPLVYLGFHAAVRGHGQRRTDRPTRRRQQPVVTRNFIGPGNLQPARHLHLRQPGRAPAAQPRVGPPADRQRGARWGSSSRGCSAMSWATRYGGSGPRPQRPR